MRYFAAALIALLMITFTACEDKKEEVPEMNNNTSESEQMHEVVVKDNMNASSYTYILVEEKGNEYWIAVPQMEVKNGETLYYTKGMEMKNFESPTLNKKFDTLLMVEKVMKSPDEQMVASSHANVSSDKKSDIKIEPVSGGKTIQQIYADKESLKGKTVKVKGKVTKFNADIMDRNWIHIQDGTGTSNDYDLLITTDKDVNLGDVITAEGTVETNKDFGSGYSYSVLISNAKVTSESK